MKKILVVEDEEIVQETLKLGLETLGYAVFVADDGEMAKKLLLKEKPDVVLIDIGLPTIDGVSLCREIKYTEGFENTPIIMITAYGDAQTYHDAFLFGACDYITKPFDIMDVKSKIEKVLSKHKEGDKE